MHIYAGSDELWYHIWDNNGLFYETGTGKRAKLCDECAGGFDAAVGDRLYVLCQNAAGDLTLFSDNNGSWLKTTVLRSRSEKPSAFGMRLTAEEKDVNVIYGLRHSGGRLIIHQSMNGGNPQVIMEAHSEKLFVRRDDAGCIYAICEVIPDLWQMCCYRYGAWSRPETVAEGCCIQDVLCKGYKDFCFLYHREGKTLFENDGVCLEIPGQKASIVNSNGYKVVSECGGRVVFTGEGGNGRIITGGRPEEFFLRLKNGAENSVCDRCRGEIVRGRIRLYLLDGLPKPEAGDSLEIMKHTLMLEARIAKIEEALSLYKPQ